MGVGRDLFGKRKDGTDVPVEISLSHYKKNGETFVIAFIVDITMRKEIEKNLLKKQEELEAVSSDIRKLNAELEAKVGERTQILKEALQRLEESQSELKEALDKEKQLNEIKSRFVSIASHEFRTPLSTVLSSASLLSRYTAAEDQDKRERHIVKIKDSVKHLNDILEDFLSLGKLDEGKIVANPDDFNCKELIEDTAEELKGLLKNNQQINVSYTGSEIIYADKKLLKNILFNLLSNAIKFSDEGSVIQVSGNIDNGSAAISVTDQGIGISENDQKHLFSSFFRGANASNIQGTGLGLHIVKRYADLLSGKVKLQSWLDKGTTVTIEFPSAADKIYL
jgi:signal transduction histidine kinase